jgi:hypothetical protein
MYFLLLFRPLAGSVQLASVRTCALLSILCPFVLSAQVRPQHDRPQFVWQGQVDGIDILYLHRNHLTVRVQEGLAVEEQQFHFNDALPESREDARLSVLEGRGYVHILDQPRLDNQYTLAVMIEDRQPGRGFYSLELYWDASGHSYEGLDAGRSDRVAWSGRVDQEAIISCSGKSCISTSDRGAPVSAEKFTFSRPLPNRNVDVRLEQALGRGEIRLVEQPRESNNFTARVSIRDPQDGGGDYSFVLSWNRSNPANVEPARQPQRGLTWSGVVDGHIRVTVKGGASVSEVVEGGPILSERIEFLRPLPSRSDPRPVLRKIRGRGRTEIVEYPSEKNNYRLIFEIDDPEPGAEGYEVEIGW